MCGATTSVPVCLLLHMPQPTVVLLCAVAANYALIWPINCLFFLTALFLYPHQYGHTSHHATTMQPPILIFTGRGSVEPLQRSILHWRIVCRANYKTLNNIVAFAILLAMRGRKTVERNILGHFSLRVCLGFLTCLETVSRVALISTALASHRRLFLYLL